MVNPGPDWRDFSLGRNAALAVFDSLKDKLPAFRDDGLIKHSLSDFDSLKKGMTYRQILRQFGFGSSHFHGGDYEFDPSNNVITVSYDIDTTDHQVVLALDTTTGLESACERVTGQVQCTELTLK